MPTNRDAIMHMANNVNKWNLEEVADTLRQLWAEKEASTGDSVNGHQPMTDREMLSHG